MNTPNPKRPWRIRIYSALGQWLAQRAKPLIESESRALNLIGAVPFTLALMFALAAGDDTGFDFLR